MDRDAARQDDLLPDAVRQDLEFVHLHLQLSVDAVDLRVHRRDGDEAGHQRDDAEAACGVGSNLGVLDDHFAFVCE
jgi:hypothetical protein